MVKRKIKVLKYQEPLDQTGLIALKKEECNKLLFESMGIDNRDIALINKMGFRWENLGDYCSSSVAEWCFYALHKLNREMGMKRELKERTALIIGSGGNIGTKIMKICRGYGINCFGHESRYPSHTEARFMKLLEVAEIIFVAIPSGFWNGKEMIRNDNFLEKKHFLAMKRKPVIINPARIGLIDLDLVQEMIDEKVIYGYALDEQPNHRLGAYTKCLFTPHNAWITKEAKKRRAKEVGKKLRKLRR